jgi:hypothetical protein
MFRLALGCHPDTISSFIVTSQGICYVGDSSDDHLLACVALQLLNHGEFEVAGFMPGTFSKTRDIETNFPGISIATINHNSKTRRVPEIEP